MGASKKKKKGVDNTGYVDYNNGYDSNNNYYYGDNSSYVNNCQPYMANYANNGQQPIGSYANNAQPYMANYVNNAQPYMANYVDNSQQPMGGYANNAQPYMGSYMNNGQQPMGGYVNNGQQPYMGNYMNNGQQPMGDFAQPQQGYVQPQYNYTPVPVVQGDASRNMGYQQNNSLTPQNSVQQTPAYGSVSQNPEQQRPMNSSLGQSHTQQRPANSSLGQNPVQQRASVSSSSGEYRRPPMRANGDYGRVPMRINSAYGSAYSRPTRSAYSASSIIRERLLREREEELEREEEERYGRSRAKKSSGAGLKVLIVVFIVLVLALAAGGTYYYFNYVKKPKDDNKVTPLFTITINKENIPNVIVGKGFQLRYVTTAKDEELDKSKLIWSSNNPQVMTVDEKGAVVARSKGDATIKLEYKDTNINDTIVMHAIEDDGEVIQLEKITINKPTNTTLTVDSTVNFSFTTIPADVDKTKVIWTSSNPDVLSVDSSQGTIAAKKAGKATITLGYDGSDLKDSIELTVIDSSTVTPPTSININGTNHSRSFLLIDETASLDISVESNGDVDYSKMTYSSSDLSTISVDKDGNLKALKSGSATITVKHSDNTSLSSSIEIQVYNNIKEIKFENKVYSLYGNFAPVKFSDIFGDITFDQAPEINYTVTDGKTNFKDYVSITEKTTNGFKFYWGKQYYGGQQYVPIIWNIA